MPQSNLDSAACDNDGGSYIEPTNTEEQSNAMAVVDGGGRSLIPQACHTEGRTSVVGDPNSNSMGNMGEPLRKYRGVKRSNRKWTAQVSNRKNDPEKSKKQVHLGTFPTAEMAAVAYDAAVLVLRGESRPNRLNFPEYSPHIKSIIEGFSPSDIANNMKYVAWKAAKNIAHLLSLKNKDSQQPKDEGFEVSTAMPAAAISSSSASLMSSNIGMRHSIHTADFPVVRPAGVKQRIKVVARAAGRARQIRRKIYDDKEDSGICCFSVMQEPEHECSTPVGIAKNNVNNEKIHPGQSSSNALGGAADVGITSLSFAYDPLHEYSVHEPKFPISNPNSMPKRVHSFDELIDIAKDPSMP